MESGVGYVTPVTTPCDRAHNGSPFLLQPVCHDPIASLGACSQLAKNLHSTHLALRGALECKGLFASVDYPRIVNPALAFLRTCYRTQRVLQDERVGGPSLLRQADFLHQ